MKKFIALIITLCVMLIMFTSCNKQIIDLNLHFDKAIVKMPDGTTETIKLKSWKDYEGEQIQLIAQDGTVYLVNSVNCILIDE